MTAIAEALRGGPGAFKERWADLPTRARRAIAIGGPVSIYLVGWLLTGHHNGQFIYDHAPLGIVALGVVYGTVTALGALGLILVYRANQFINFAHGALGSLVGVLAIGMVLEHGVNYWIALPSAVAIGAVMGAVVEFLVIRRFQNASRLVLTVASIGLAQFLGGLELLGSKQIGFLSLVGGFSAPLDIKLKLDVTTLHGDEMLIIAIVPAVIAVLAWFLLKTDAGIGVRASAENVERALLLGIPVRRLSTIVWLIAGGLATLTYMLQAPFAGVKPGVAANGPTVLLPLLAVAVIARMESLPAAFAGGVALGIMEQIVRWNNPETSTIVYLFYLVVILGALLLQRGKLSRAKEGGGSSWSAIGSIKPIPEVLRRLPEVRGAKIAVLGLTAAAFVVLPRGWGGPDQLLGAFALVWAMIGVSLVVLTGWGGNISLGQFGIAGIAGMVAGNVAANNNMDFFLVILLCGAVGAVASMLVGVPALRIRGLFLAVTTLAFALTLDNYILNQNNFPQFIQTEVSRPLIWERFDGTDNYVMYLACLAFTVLSILAAVGVRKARSGRVLIATRDNQRAADAASIATTNAKLSGFLLAGVIAGVAGCLDVYLVGGLAVGTFDPVSSLTVFSTAIIGGMGSLTGAIVGVLLFKYLETLTFLGDLRLLINGTGLLVVLYALPGGLGQLIFAQRDRYLRWVANRHDLVVPNLVADKRVEGEKKGAADEVDLLKGALGGRVPVGAGR